MPRSRCLFMSETPPYKMPQHRTAVHASPYSHNSKYKTPFRPVPSRTAPVVVLADGTVGRRLLPEGHKRHPARPPVRAVDDPAAHDGAAGAELRGQQFKADLIVQVRDKQLNFSGPGRTIDTSVERAARGKDTRGKKGVRVGESDSGVYYGALRRYHERLSVSLARRTVVQQ